MCTVLEFPLYNTNKQKIVLDERLSVNYESQRK